MVFSFLMIVHMPAFHLSVASLFVGSKIKKLYDQYMSLKAERDDTRNDYEGQVTGLHYDSLLTIIILCAFWALCY
eukprot:m.192289 g.192289  ORF g.192289 m.192289 type:complete len:75 (+) comp16765_c0_seq10:1979-2203(+)